MKARLETTVRTIAIAAMLLASPLVIAANAQPTLNFDGGGSTTVRLDDALLPTLSSLGVSVASVAPGKVSGNARGVFARFGIPASGGSVDLTSLSLEILHTGGLTFSGGGITVETSTYIIENLGGALQLTGLVKVGDSIVGRIPLFDIALTNAPSVRQGQIQVGGAELTLAQDAADALNGVFGTDAFVEGIPVGVAEIRSRRARGVSIRRR